MHCGFDLEDEKLGRCHFFSVKRLGTPSQSELNCKTLQIIWITLSFILEEPPWVFQIILNVASITQSGPLNHVHELIVSWFKSPYRMTWIYFSIKTSNRLAARLKVAVCST
jgi:hypothetical protein